MQGRRQRGGVGVSAGADPCLPVLTPHGIEPLFHKRADRAVTGFVSDFSGPEAYFQDMRRFAIRLILLAVLWPAVAIADLGNGNRHGNENGQGHSNNGNGNAGGNGSDAADIPPTAPAGNDQTVARDALENGSTLPLAAIARLAAKAAAGRLIDAQLLVVNKTPIYRLTLIDSHGVTRRVYYDARTAKPVGPP